MVLMERKGERIGWTWGWSAGFVWVAILGVVFLVQGKVVAGATGLLIFVAATWAIRRFAPWRYPTTPYWRLYLGLFVLFLLMIPWAIWAFGGLGDEQLNGWMLLWLLPLFASMFTNGRKTWADGESGTRQNV